MLPSRGIGLLVVIVLFALRHYVFDKDKYRCKALIHSGHWLSDRWIVSGCNTVDYGKNWLPQCTNGQKRDFVFAGDLQLQGIYHHFVQRLTTDKNKKIPVFEERDFHHESTTATVSFLYDPYLNGSALFKVFGSMRDEKPDRPMLTVIGAGNYAVQTEKTKEYLLKVQSLASTAMEGQTWRKFGSSISYTDGAGDLLMFAPAEEPSPGTKMSSSAHRLNQDLNRVSLNSPIEVLSAWTDMTTGLEKPFQNEDSLLLSEQVIRARAEMLLSLRCNGLLAARGIAWAQVTCCANWRAPTLTQCMFLILAGLILPGVVFLDAHRAFLSTTARPVFRAISSFSGVMLMIYVIDRTHVMEHHHKDIFRWDNWGTFLIATAILGLATIRKSKGRGKGKVGDEPPDQFLSRDQTDEWKGWMQIMMITIHYGLAASPHVWQFGRVCVSAYLCMTGFGHTVYFLQKKDFSLKRFTNVIVRVNLTTVTLTYVMRTAWAAYYYIPLCTIWVIIIYVTLAMGRKYNSNTRLLLGKIVLSACLVDLFFATKGAREALVKFCVHITKGAFPIAFFDRRMVNDRYVVYVGMALAPLYLWLTKILNTDKLPPDEKQSPRAMKVVKHWEAIKRSSVVFAGLGMIWMCWFCSSKSKPGFSTYQACIDPFAIICFVLLRNGSPWLRKHYSTAFAWLGRYSGEMYVLHCHIWLAGDQDALLRSGLFHGDETLFRDRWRDLIVLTPIYLTAAAIAGDATGIIANWFVSDWSSGVGTIDQRAMNAFDEKVWIKDKKEFVVERRVRWNDGWWQRFRPDLAVLRFLLALETRVILVLLVLWGLNISYA